MKTLTRVALYAMAFSFVSPLPLFAQNSADFMPDGQNGQDMEWGDDAFLEDDIQSLQDEMMQEKKAFDEEMPEGLKEARGVLNSFPSTKDAVTGTIDTTPIDDPYDIYMRQLAYREGAKKYRASLEARREKFAAPREKLINRYHRVRDGLYAAEASVYQTAVSERKAEGGKPAAASKPKAGSSSSEDAGRSQAVEDNIQEKTGLTERKIPGGSERGEQVVQRKVITSEDAPSFDPAKLGEERKDSKPASSPVSGDDVKAQADPSVTVVEDEPPLMPENSEGAPQGGEDTSKPVDLERLPEPQPAVHPDMDPADGVAGPVEEEADFEGEGYIPEQDDEGMPSGSGERTEAGEDQAEAPVDSSAASDDLFNDQFTEFDDPFADGEDEGPVLSNPFGD
ncbi:MAG: hypothetical protein ACLFP8_03495 [Alphaproteobacteria bacterium]